VKLHIGRVPEGMAQRSVQYTVTVKSNDPEKEIVRLSVKAAVVRKK